MIVFTLFSLLFYASVGFQLFFWGILAMRLVFFRSPSGETAYQGPVSVIICAKNEAENLRKYLPKVLQQEYPDFEVLVVDDQSSDDSLYVLENLQKENKHLRILKIHPKEPSSSGKKYALSKGIEAAKYPVLLLTDADCEPASTSWIQSMMAGFSSEKRSIVLGYGPYRASKGLVNAFTRFETLYSAIQYFTFTLWGMPYMAVGRNLAYRKTLYDEAGGFNRHKQVISGDDDLFIRDAANPFNISLVTIPDSFTYSLSKLNWRNYFRQKKRHISTSNHYKLGVKIALGFLSLSHLLFFSCICFSGIFHLSPSWLIELIILRCLTTYAVYGAILTKWKQLSLLPWIPVLEVMLLFYFVVLAPFLFVRKTIPWK